MEIVTIETCKSDKKITYRCTDSNLEKEILEKINRIKKDPKNKEKLYQELQYLLELCDCIDNDDSDDSEYEYKISEVLNIK